MAILNSLKHFTIPAFAPCLLNISLIIFALAFGEGISGLALGVLVGGVLQLMIQLPLVYKKGFRLKLFQKFRHPQALLVGKLMLPRLVSSGIYQLNNFVDSIFGSLAFIVGDGGVAVLYFAYRLIQFPLGIFSTALSQAILPSMSCQAAEGKYGDLKHTLSFGLRTSFFVMLPASAGFIVLAQPIVRLLFGGGRFDSYSAQNTASALAFYSLGLFAYGATRIVQSCFFALKDTLTPTKVSAIALGLNVVLNAFLMFPLKIAGIALATSLSGIISFFILFFIVQRRLAPLNLKEIAVSLAKALCASALMGLVCYYLSLKLVVANKFLHLGLIILVAICSYLVFCFLLRVSELSELKSWLSKNR
jgi:putative peptidoglycan lipid II flippase